MESVEDIIIRYYKAYLEFSRLIDEKAKGDWSKAELLISNNDRAKQLLDGIYEALSDFEQATSAGKVYQLSDDFVTLSERMIKQLDKEPKPVYITGFLKHIRDEWEEKTEAGDVEDLGIVDGLKAFFSLPNFNPDDWLKRKFLIRGVRISPSFNISKKIEIGFSEACCCFIYGQNLATCALARAVMEASLKEKFIFFENMDLYDIIHNGWWKVDQLKKHPELNKKAEKIRQAGNEVLHRYDDNKIRQLINELNARTVLFNLKELLEYLYG